MTSLVVGLLVASTLGMDAPLRAQQSPAASPAAAPQEGLGALKSQFASLVGAGKYTEALPIAERILALERRRYGEERGSVAAAVHNVARMHHALGHYSQAQPLAERALSMREKLLNPDHYEIGESHAFLGTLAQAQGRYGPAEASFKRALAIFEAAGDDNKWNIAATLGDLAHVYQTLDRLAEAEPLLDRALAIYESNSNPRSTGIAIALSDLSALYRSQGRLQEAETAIRRALARYETALGPDHLATGTAVGQLAGLTTDLGRYAEAESLAKRSLAIAERVLGEAHPTVASRLRALANVLAEQGRYGDAEAHYRRALAITEQALGQEHASTASTLSELALVLTDEGRYAEAEDLLKRGIAIAESTLGQHHKNVGLSLNSLALLYDKQMRSAEAEALYRRALAISEAALPPQSPVLGILVNNLAMNALDQGRDDEVERLLRRSLAILETAHGGRHPVVRRSLLNLAKLADKQGRRDDAAELRRRAEAIPGWETADVPVLFATNREMVAPPIGSGAPATFGNDQVPESGRLNLGLATVQAPKSEVRNRADRVGQAAGVLHRAKGRQTDEGLLSLHRVTPVADAGAALWAETKQNASRAVRFPKQALVYVHGYNNSFEDAVRRSAMIAFDLDFDGPVAAFSWPSRSSFAAYASDRARAKTAAPYLVEFLERFGAALPDVKVHILAHSTGGEVVLDALEKLADGNKVSSRGGPIRLGEIILAHADVAPARLAGVMSAVAPIGIGLTSYSSREDLAMRVSDMLRGEGARVGGAPVYIAGVDSIDVTGLGLSFSLNHAVFVHNPMVFGDMARLMATGERIPGRRSPAFAGKRTPQGVHWVFEPLPASPSGR